GRARRTVAHAEGHHVRADVGSGGREGPGGAAADGRPIQRPPHAAPRVRRGGEVHVLADPQLELPIRWRGLGLPCRIRRPALLYPSFLRPSERDSPCRDDRGQRGESPEPQHVGRAFPKPVRVATRPPAHRAHARASGSVGRTHRGRVYFRGSCRFARSFPSWWSCWLALSARMGRSAPVEGRSSGASRFPTASSARRTTTASTATRAPTTSATWASASTTPAATGTRATTATRAPWATAAATAPAPA